MDKKELRRELIARRDAIGAAERVALSRRLTQRLAGLAEYRLAKAVLATMSIGSEWDTRAFIEGALAGGKTVVLPRITPPPRRLELHAVRDLGADLVAGIWNIPEPDPDRCERVDLAHVDFALIPALAVDSDRYRLGYGAGYFDALLAGRGARPYCIAALASQFHVRQLPRDAHDVALDAAISEVA